MASNDTTTDAPLADNAAERDAIREALPDDIHVLMWHGGESYVALVQREKAPPTEHANRQEDIILLDWVDGEDYALSLAKGKATGISTVDEVVSTHDTRAEALNEVVAEFERIDE